MTQSVPSKNPRFKRSRQRDEIFRLLQSTQSHPTAEWIYAQLKPVLPKLSLGTVYRNLRILNEQQKILRLECGSGYDRYDATVEPHYHICCHLCRRVVDIQIPYNHALNQMVEHSVGWKVDYHRIDFHGTCNQCQSN